MSLCLTTSNLVFLFQAQIFILSTLLLITGVGVDTYNAINKVHTYVVDPFPCSISLIGYIAEEGENWYDAASTFLVYTKEGLGSPEHLWSSLKRPLSYRNLCPNWSAT